MIWKVVLFAVMAAMVGVAQAEAVVGCVTPWKDTIIHNNIHTNIHNRFQVTVNPANVRQGQRQSQTQQQAQKQGQQQSLSNQNQLGNIGNPVFTVESVPDFVMPYVPQPATPLHYVGPYPDKTESQYAGDQPEFQQIKWMADEIANLPDGGKITPVIRHKVEPVKYIQPRTRVDYLVARQMLNDYITAKNSGMTPQEMSEKDIRPGLLGELIWHGNVYCKSAGPDDNPGTVWGGCSKVLVKSGCTYAYKIAGVVIYGARSKATNQSGGISFASIFGHLFGINAGAGASNTDHDASPYEMVNSTWSCFGRQPQQQGK